MWVVPGQERVQTRLRDRDYSNFQLCGLYTALAISFLLFFAFAALLRGEVGYAFVMLGFCAVTVLAYVTSWYSRNYAYLRHFLSFLLALLCLYLYYTGGTDNTGPMYLFVFPLVSVFLQGMRVGAVSVLLLLACTLVLQSGVFGFDGQRYEAVLVVRVVAIYLLVSLLILVFEYFRLNAEKELLQALQELSQASYSDVGTHLANRRLMEKLLIAEIGRAQRYPVDCCVMLLEPDADLQQGDQLEQQRLELSQILRRQLRMQDIPGVWDVSRFMVLLPLTRLDGAVIVAERLLAECRKQQGEQPQPGRRLSVSIALASVRQQSAEVLIAALQAQLEQARLQGGNRMVIAADAVSADPGMV